MASNKLSAQDKKDMDKFAKYLVYKCIQIIVQSRLGEKVRTKSKSFSSGSDWVSVMVLCLELGYINLSCFVLIQKRNAK